MIVVPALIILFDVTDLFPSDQFPANTGTLLAIGTSLSTILFTTASAAYAQIRRGMVEWSVVRRWVVFLSVGSLGSSYVASGLSDFFLKVFIATLVLFVACVMLTSWKPSPSRDLPGRFLSALLASIGGMVAGIAGIGGANIVVQHSFTLMLRSCAPRPRRAPSVPQSHFLGQSVTSTEARRTTFPTRGDMFTSQQLYRLLPPASSSHPSVFGLRTSSPRLHYVKPLAC